MYVCMPFLKKSIDKVNDIYHITIQTKAIDMCFVELIKTTRNHKILLQRVHSVVNSPAAAVPWDLLYVYYYYQ